jgi:hypothetical protein
MVGVGFGVEVERADMRNWINRKGLVSGYMNWELLGIFILEINEIRYEII